MDGQTDKRSDGRAGGRTDGRTDGQITFVIFQLILKLFKSILTICTAILDINIIIGTYSFWLFLFELTNHTMYGPQDSLLNSIRQSVYNSLNINARASSAFLQQWIGDDLSSTFHSESSVYFASFFCDEQTCFQCMGLSHLPFRPAFYGMLPADRSARHRCEYVGLEFQLETIHCFSQLVSVGASTSSVWHCFASGARPSVSGFQAPQSRGRRWRHHFHPSLSLQDFWQLARANVVAIAGTRDASSCGIACALPILGGCRFPRANPHHIRQSVEQVRDAVNDPKQDVNAGLFCTGQQLVATTSLRDMGALYSWRGFGWTPRWLQDDRRILPEEAISTRRFFHFKPCGRRPWWWYWNCELFICSSCSPPAVAAWKWWYCAEFRHV